MLFFDGSILLGANATSPYSFDWIGASVGAHALTAVARDNGGLSTTSAVVNVTVALPNPTPTPTLISLTASPSAGQLTVTGSTDISGSLVTEKTASLAPVDWQPGQTNSVPGGPFSLTIPMGAEPQAFFRLKGQ